MSGREGGGNVSKSRQHKKRPIQRERERSGKIRGEILCELGAEAVGVIVAGFNSP